MINHKLNSCYLYLFSKIRLNRFKILSVNSKKKEKKKEKSKATNRTSYESHFETISWKIANHIVNKKRTYFIPLILTFRNSFQKLRFCHGIPFERNSTSNFFLEYISNHGIARVYHITLKNKKIYVYIPLDKNIRQRIRDRGTRGNEFLIVGSRRQKTTAAIPAAHWLEWSWPSEAPTGCLI